MKFRTDRPLTFPEAGARKIVEICRANLRDPNTVNRDRHTPGPYTDMEVINRGYYEANQGSHEGFQAVLKHGAEVGLFTVHASGTRVFLVG
jgi:hypothetical protein